MNEIAVVNPTRPAAGAPASKPKHIAMAIQAEIAYNEHNLLQSLITFTADEEAGGNTKWCADYFDVLTISQLTTLTIMPNGRIYNWTWNNKISTREMFIRSEATKELKRRHKRHTESVNYSNSYILYRSLDLDSQILAQRAAIAVSAILMSPEYQNGTCGTIPSSDLAIHKWEIAVALRDITESRKNLPADAGPLTAPILAAQLKAVAIAEKATTTRIEALEYYASQVTKADAARRDWTTAQEAAARNEQYRDLVAKTAATMLNTNYLEDLGTHAEAFSRGLQEILADAVHAAEILAL